MKRYCIKSQPGKTDYMDIISETEEGLTIRLTTISNGHEKVREDYMARNLFEMCLKTGYVYEMTGDKLNYSAA